MKYFLQPDNSEKLRVTYKLSSRTYGTSELWSTVELKTQSNFSFAAERLRPLNKSTWCIG